MQEEWCVRDAIGRAAVREGDEIREVQRGGRDKEDVGFQEVGVANNVEEICERCKTETNIEMRREGGMAKIMEKTKVVELKEQEDEKNLTSGRNSGTERLLRKHDPRQPSQQEKEEHEMTHLPFRCWCRQCITGRGREEDCRKSMEEERQVPEVHLDYMFMGDEKEGKTLAFLVARDRKTRAVLSTGVPRKTTGEWICRRLMAWPSRDWTGVCGHHREVRQRTGVDKFDCVMEHDEGNDEWIKDDHREQSSWQFKEQWNCREGDPVKHDRPRCPLPMTSTRNRCHTHKCSPQNKNR